MVKRNTITGTNIDLPRDKFGHVWMAKQGIINNNNNNNNNRLYLKRVTHLVTKLIFHEAL